MKCEQYVAQLIRTNTAQGALRIARDSYLSTQQGFPPHHDLAERDLKLRSIWERQYLATRNFWDQVFGITLKKVLPGLSRKNYLAGSATAKGA